MDYVLANRFKPGDKLPSTKTLAAMFDVGYPTLREALKKLETVGALSIQHGSGIYVSEQLDDWFISNPLGHKPSAELLLDHLQVMVSLEGQVMELLAERATEEDLGYLQALVDKEEVAKSEAEIIDLHMDFHLYAAKATRNLVLYELIKVTSKAFGQEEQLLPKLVPVSRKDYEVRVQIMEALYRRDGSQAADLIRQHLLDAIETLKTNLAGDQVQEKDQS